MKGEYCVKDSNLANILPTNLFPIEKKHGLSLIVVINKKTSKETENMIN